MKLLRWHRWYVRSKALNGRFELLLICLLYTSLESQAHEATHSVSKTKITDDQADSTQPHTGKEIVDPEIPTTMPQQEEPVSPDQQEHRDED